MERVDRCVEFITKALSILHHYFPTSIGGISSSIICVCFFRFEAENCNYFAAVARFSLLLGHSFSI